MKRLFATLLFCGAILLLPRLAFAHAVLVSSTPAAHAVVPGPDVNISLHFNSRVDGERSHVFIVVHGNQAETVPLLHQDVGTDLAARIVLKPGSYKLRWQALSTDGHITRGEIPFTVR